MTRYRVDSNKRYNNSYAKQYKKGASISTEYDTLEEAQAALAIAKAWARGRATITRVIYVGV